MSYHAHVQVGVRHVVRKLRAVGRSFPPMHHIPIADSSPDRRVMRRCGFFHCDWENCVKRDTCRDSVMRDFETGGDASRRCASEGALVVHIQVRISPREILHIRKSRTGS
jgi:hypothetical protein